MNVSIPLDLSHTLTTLCCSVELDVNKPWVTVIKAHFVELILFSISSVILCIRNDTEKKKIKWTLLSRGPCSRGAYDSGQQCTCWHRTDCLCFWSLSKEGSVLKAGSGTRWLTLCLTICFMGPWQAGSVLTTVLLHFYCCHWGTAAGVSTTLIFHVHRGSYQTNLPKRTTESTEF